MSDSTGQVSDRLHKLVQDSPNLALLKGQKDLVITMTYADAGTSDERLLTAVYSSATLTGVTVTITLTYAGSPGGYYNTVVTYS